MDFEIAGTKGTKRREVRESALRFLSKSFLRDNPGKREAQPFPLRTLVLAYARSRHIRPGMP